MRRIKRALDDQDEETEAPKMQTQSIGSSSLQSSTMAKKPPTD